MPTPSTTVPDHQVLRGFLRDDRTACRTVEQWAYEVVSYGTYRVPVDARDDLVQLTLTKVWSAVSHDDFSLHTSFRAFVRRVASARCIDWIRGKKNVVEMDDRLEDPQDSPYESLAKRDQWARLQMALEASSESCREIIRLHFFEDVPYKDIAEKQDRAESTLRVRLFNCMKKLRAAMARLEG